MPQPLYDLMRSAPLVAKLVVPMEARLRMLVEDYAGEEAVRLTGGDWADRMEESIEKMGKRLGGDRVKSCVAALRRGDVLGVAQDLVSHYDKLYDRHVANAGGTGNGTGERSGSIVEVALASDSDRLDEKALARALLATVAEFDSEGGGGAKGKPSRVGGAQPNR